MTQDVGALTPLLAGPDALEPEDVAAALWDAFDDDRFLVLPHPEVAGFVEAKAHDVDAWLGSMNRLGARLRVPRAFLEEEQ
jgi:hypothetical protein